MSGHSALAGGRECEFRVQPLDALDRSRYARYMHISESCDLDPIKLEPSVASLARIVYPTTLPMMYETGHPARFSGVACITSAVRETESPNRFNMAPRLDSTMCGAAESFQYGTGLQFRSTRD